MECSKGFINLSQVVINTLKEGTHLETYFCFRNPIEAKQLVRILDLFCDIELKYIEISFYNDPRKDQTIALRVFNKPLGSAKNFIHYLDNDVKKFIDTLKVTKTPEALRSLVRNNFL
jgi:hypothetical protein